MCPNGKLYLYPERQRGEHLKEKKIGQNRQGRTNMIKADITGHPGHVECLGQITGQP
jgi:hypothetical protein